MVIQRHCDYLGLHSVEWHAGNYNNESEMTWKQDIPTNLRHYPSICLEGLGINMANIKQDIGVSAEIQTTYLLNTSHTH